MTTDREPKPSAIPARLASESVAGWPAHWQFRERVLPGVEILACEPDLGYLELKLPDSLSPKVFQSYIFEKNGHAVGGLTIRENQGTTPIGIYLEGEPYSTEFTLRKFLGQDTYSLTVCIGEGFADRATVDWYKTLARIEYKGWRDRNRTTWGNLDFISLQGVFDKGENGRAISSPIISLYLQGGISSEAVAAVNWKVYDMDKQGVYRLESESPTSILATHNKGLNNYRVSWEVVDGALIVTQHHLGRDTEKIVTARLTVEISELIVAAFFSIKDEGYCQEFEKNNRTIPWTKFERQVGFRVRHTYPSPNNSDNPYLNYKPGIV